MTTGNPLVDGLKLPGVSISLPTRGRFYDDGVLAPDADPENITVTANSLWNETAFRDPYRIMSGKAYTDLLRVACPEILKPDQISNVDMELIFIASRIASSGNEIDFNNNCLAIKEDGTIDPEAKRPEDSSQKFPCEGLPLKLDLRHLVLRYTELEKPNEWRMTLDNGQTVQLRPVRYSKMLDMYRHILDIMRAQRQIRQQGGNDNVDEEQMLKIQSGIMDSSTVSQEKLFSESVWWVETADGAIVSQREFIDQWIDMLPSAFVDKINEKIEDVAGESFKFGVVEANCERCGLSREINAVADPSRFFGNASQRQTTPLRR